MESILIVDEDASVRDLLSSTLKKEGYETVHACHGEEALTHLLNTKKLPCLIFIESTLPVMDGWYFREIQRNHFRLMEIPLTLMSSAPLTKEYLGYFQAFSYLQKPLKTVDILSIVNSLEQWKGNENLK